MTEVLKAIRYKNLEEARQALQEIDFSDKDIFNDHGSEPQGLLSAVPEDCLPEEEFYRLFDLKRGTLVEVEKIRYSGYGPPAEEPDYMGFISRKTAYVLKGCRAPVEIENCPQGAQDIHHLEALILNGRHPIDRQQVAGKLQLGEEWDFDDIFQLILAGEYTGEEIDRLIHRGIQ